MAERRRLRLLALGALLPLLLASPSPADDGLAVLPRQVTLDGPQSQHALLVLHTTDEQLGRPAEKAELTSSDPTIVRVEGRLLLPVADGTATVTAKLGARTAAAEVTVVGAGQPADWSFRNDVLPVLSKTGCNSGACHGALAGKGGFRLSLRGYDPVTDHFNMTRQARGRRVELADPGRSLVLAKPTGAIPHKGGVRFEVGSRPYRILSGWIAAGAPAPRDDDPLLEQVELLPSASRLEPGQRQQMLVRAHYSDGRVVDVTRWAKFSSADESVARVDQQGQVEVIGSGEGAVTAWFSSKIAIARITAPYGPRLSDEQLAAEQPRNFIDRLVLEKLQQLGLPPSPLCSDEDFVRRAFLDTIGVLPTADEVRGFLADPDPAKRDRLVDQLLQRPEFVDYWTYRWSDLLTINGTRLRPVGVKTYYQWIREHVQRNTPWDQFVREIITAQGRTDVNGATNFYALHQDPEAMTENACQAFLGLSIGCAKCHNHPLEKWTNDQYYGMANLFARVRGKGWGGDSRNGDGIRTVYVETKGDLIQPLRGRPQPPRPLDGEPLEFGDPGDRREALARWMTSRDNPYFARSITNRVWANFFGVGLVESVDDMRVSNPASNERLLSAAAQHLADEAFDLKSLMRTILRSRTYQRSSQPLEANHDDRRFYSRYYPRRLMAEVMLDAISQVADVPTEFNQILFPGADKRKTDFYPKGTRAVQLFDSAVASYFLKTFGRNTREITCECERSDEASMVQVLHLCNGDTLNQKLAHGEGRLQKLIDAGADDQQILDELFLGALSRQPTDEERKRLLQLVASADDRRIALEDLFWSVMTSREFLFNH